MPTYEYECRACGHAFELFQGMSDPVKRKCPKCGKAKLERLIGTGSGVIFKGSGFYQTDYRSEGYKKDAEADRKSSKGVGAGGDEEKKESAADSKAAPEKSAESKPADKIEKKPAPAEPKSRSKKSSRK